MKKVIVWACLLCAVVSLSGCGAKGYDGLSDRQKQIVDNILKSSGQWEKTDVKYGVYEAKGESVFRNISFVQYSGGLGFRVVYAMNQSGTEIVQRYYSYDQDRGAVQLEKEEYAVVYGNGIGKSWYTSWSIEEKQEAVAQRLLDFNQN